jgi:hypothetical protein
VAPESGQGVTGWREGRAERAATRAPKEVGIMESTQGRTRKGNRKKKRRRREETKGRRRRGGGGKRREGESESTTTEAVGLQRQPMVESVSNGRLRRPHGSCLHYSYTLFYCCYSSYRCICYVLLTSKLNAMHLGMIRSRRSGSANRGTLKNQIE